MKHLIIIQARMGSSRLPGKSLSLLKGKPSLLHLSESLLQAFQKESILVATTEKSKDDPICLLCENAGLQYYRGDEEHVALRFYAALNIYKPVFFVRLNGDSPLFDYRILRGAIDNNSNSDIITTVSDKPYPSGMNFEIIRTSVFLNAYPRFSTQPQREHVTKFFYEHPGNLKFTRLVSPVENSSRYKFTIDTREDLLRITKIFEAMDKPHYCYSLQEKCELYKKLFPDKNA